MPVCLFPYIELADLCGHTSLGPRPELHGLMGVYILPFPSLPGASISPSPKRDRASCEREGGCGD